MSMELAGITMLLTTVLPGGKFDRQTSTTGKIEDSFGKSFLCIWQSLSPWVVARLLTDHTVPH